MTRHRPPPEWRPRLNQSEYNLCTASGCPLTARHGPLCYKHTAESRAKLAAELQRLRRHHASLLEDAVTLVDKALDGADKLTIQRAALEVAKHEPPKRPQP